MANFLMHIPLAYFFVQSENAEISTIGRKDEKSIMIIGHNIMLHNLPLFSPLMIDSECDE